LLTTSPFLLALVTLIVNDAWLKGAFPGLITGKLSDFAGIAMVTMLGLRWFPRRQYLVYGCIAGGFAWWKCPGSQGFIDAMNSISPVTIGRTIDYTDLVALLMMPACAVVVRRAGDFQFPAGQLRRLLWAPIGVATVLALMATTTLPPRQGYAIRTIETTGTLDRARVVREIDQVARDFKLKCVDCSDPLNSGSYKGKGISLVYRFTDARTVAFWTEGEMEGMFGGRHSQKLDNLRARLKVQLAGTQVGLEFVQSLDGNLHPP